MQIDHTFVQCLWHPWARHSDPLDVPLKTENFKASYRIFYLESFFRSDFIAETSEPATILVLFSGFYKRYRGISTWSSKRKKYADNRIPTLEEIRKVVEYPDRRIKAIVYTMASSGIRIVAWDYLQWENIRPLEKDGKIIATKMIVYAGEDDEYFTFISPEAWKALTGWISYRETSCELINNDSWIMRDLWDTRVAEGRGLVTKPKKLASFEIKSNLGTRTQEEIRSRKKRHPYQANHSLRKWFQTSCEIAGMKPINIEKLMNHSIGISNSYCRATENEVLADYLKAVDQLTNNGDSKILEN